MQSVLVYMTNVDMVIVSNGVAGPADAVDD